MCLIIRYIYHCIYHRELQMETSDRTIPLTSLWMNSRNRKCISDHLDMYTNSSTSLFWRKKRFVSQYHIEINAIDHIRNRKCIFVYKFKYMYFATLKEERILLTVFLLRLQWISEIENASIYKDSDTLLRLKKKRFVSHISY